MNCNVLNKLLIVILRSLVILSSYGVKWKTKAIQAMAMAIQVLVVKCFDFREIICEFNLFVFSFVSL